MSNWEPLAQVEVYNMLDKAPFQWWLAGGYAIELFVGFPFRRHSDIDILFLRSDASKVRRYLSNWECWAASPPGNLRLWPEGEDLPLDAHDVWCRKPGGTHWNVQLMFDGEDGTCWVSRRNPALRRNRNEIGFFGINGLPILVPEIQLFYKAKMPRDVDHLDFDKTLEVLSPRQKEWLFDSIVSTYSAKHPWLERLCA